jgi:pimeloyl-ACP methyl ester carboxylesterase
MVSSVQAARLPDGRPLASQYDLVLSFDYDALNMTIDDAARALNHRLETVGLGTGHAKTIHLVAHSTGGLLARWYIEREGGNQAVRRLVMLGTPNGGWPWPRFDDWARVVLGLGLNQLTAIVWPASVIGSLVGLIENASVVPAEIRPGGRIIEALQSSHDPGIPYILLAGTASIPPPPSESASSTWEGMIKRLITQIASEEVFFNLLNPSSPQQSNDLAVAMMRMEALPAGWKHPCEVRSVACDHLSYFTSEAGLKGLAEALAP